MKFLTFLLLVLIAPIMAGMYGAIHDQITYTIYPEFFTLTRFGIEGISPDIHPRLGAAISGINNAWKLGIPLGLLLSLVGLIHSGHRKMFFFTLQSFLIALGLAVFAALIAVVLPVTEVSSDINMAHFPSISDPLKFSKVVSVNNFARAGAIIGMILGVGWHAYITKKDNISEPEKE
jgi:hypothetical protein